MLPQVQDSATLDFSGVGAIIFAPLLWIPDWQALMIDFAWYGGSTFEVILKWIILLPPVLLLVAAIWVTMISLYTVPFRYGRIEFLTALVTSWWDAGRSVWFYWAGIVRLAVVLVGWIWGILKTFVKLVAAVFKGAFKSPLLVLDWTSRKYFKPGVPWVAFLGLLFWAVIEGIIFTFTLTPTMIEVLAGITGYEPNPAVMAPILFIFLFFLILGSFACLHALADAFRQRKTLMILEMIFVELFVMFFEVIFLYRELIDAVTPWIAQQTGGQLQLGLVATLLLASFGWVGVRGMTWFLFGRYGTPALLAVLSRQTITRDEEAPRPAMAAPPPPDLWRGPITALKEETEWFKKEGREVFALISLPVLQLLAAAMNFITVLILARPMFSLPFNSLEEVRAATPKMFSSKGAPPASSHSNEGGMR